MGEPVVFARRAKRQGEMQPVESNRQKWPRWWVLTVFALAMAVRMGVARAFPLDAGRDPDSYLRFGSNLCASGVYSDLTIINLGVRGYVPTAFRPPLYPLVIAACSLIEGSGLFLLAAIHVVLGAATAGLVFLIAERWNLSKRGALLAAALVAIDPILLNQSVQPMTETLAAFLAALGLFALTIVGNRLSIRWAMLAGGILALAELCRPTFLVWLLLCGLGLVVLARGWRQRLLVGGSFALAAALVVGPWAARNYREFDQPIITTTHGGFTLGLANNPVFYRHLSKQGWFAPWDADDDTWIPIDALQDESETSEDRLFYAQAFATIRDQPRMFFVSCLYRLSRLWGVCPIATDPQESTGHRLLRYAVAVFYLFEFALAGWGAWLVGRNWLKTPWLWGLLLVLSFTAVHTVYWTDMRMRAPFIGVIALAAGAGLSGKGGKVPGQGLAAQSFATSGPTGNLP